MLTVTEAEARAAALVERAARAGADASDAVYYANASTSVQVRLGELEDVARSEAETVSLRLFIGSRSASVSSSDLSDEALAALVERAAAMAREAPEDPWSGLAPDELLMREAGPDVDGTMAATLRRSSSGIVRWRSRTPQGTSPGSPTAKARASAPAVRWSPLPPATAFAAAIRPRVTPPPPA